MNDETFKAFEFLEGIKGQINHNDVVRAYTEGYEEGYSKGDEINALKVRRSLEYEHRRLSRLRSYIVESTGLKRKGSLESLDKDILDNMAELEDKIGYFEKADDAIEILFDKVYTEIDRLKKGLKNKNKSESSEKEVKSE